MAKKDSDKTIKMVWVHKTLPKGTKENVFGVPGVANENGHLVVEVSMERAKNENNRRKKLIPLAIYEKEAKMRADFEKQLEELE